MLKVTISLMRRHTSVTAAGCTRSFSGTIRERREKRTVVADESEERHHVIVERHLARLKLQLDDGAGNVLGVGRGLCDVGGEEEFEEEVEECVGDGGEGLDDGGGVGDEELQEVEEAELDGAVGVLALGDMGKEAAEAVEDEIDGDRLQQHRVISLWVREVRGDDHWMRFG